MAQIIRSTKIAGGTVLQANTNARAADVETDMLTLFNAHNNADTGVTPWQVVSASNATSVPLVSNNSTGTQNILELKDNGTSCLTVADGGTLTVAPGGTTKAVLNSTGLALSNSATLAMGAAKITGLANGTVATDAAAFGQLKIVQTVTVTNDTTFNTTSSTYQTTNLTLAITPTSASNRVLAIVTGDFEASANTTIFFLTIFRASTDLSAGPGLNTFQFGTSTGTFRVPVAMVIVDSPATTSSTTYSVKLKNLNNSSTGNFPSTAASGTGRTTLTLIEVV